MIVPNELNWQLVLPCFPEAGAESIFVSTLYFCSFRGTGGRQAGTHSVKILRGADMML